MDVKKLEELLAHYKSKLRLLDNETLRLIAINRSRALEYAEKGIGSVEPENLNINYIETIANEMQALAKMLLVERKK